MNAFLNYLLEATIGLCLFLLAYQLLLRKETNFRLNRLFLLIAVIASITFPLVTISAPESPVPSMNLSIPTVEITPTYLPTEPENNVVQDSINLWSVLAKVYIAGLIVTFILFAVRLTKMLTTLKRATKSNHKQFKIVELSGNDSPFSFFRYIFISSDSPLSETERQQIIEHESIHANLHHSIDIILLNVLGIIFWFNPFIRTYKKIFVQLHEFEADARAVEKHDVDEYCSLVARVALYSADFKLANHFSNSLTIKRIEMMRTLKQKIKSWKVAAMLATLPIFFFVVACQDQVNETPAVIETEVASQTTKLPANVETALNRLKAESPNDKFIVMPPTSDKLKDFAEKEIVNGSTTVSADAITVIKSDQKDRNGNSLTYIILQYKNQAKAEELEEIAIEEPKGEEVFMIVEEPPVFPGGPEQAQAFIRKNARYPESTRKAKIEGSVYISFINEKVGSVQNAQVLKGINPSPDAEALRVINSMPAWTPGKQNGKQVRVRFVMPVKFKL